MPEPMRKKTSSSGWYNFGKGAVIILLLLTAGVGIWQTYNVVTKAGQNQVVEDLKKRVAEMEQKEKDRENAAARMKEREKSKVAERKAREDAEKKAKLQAEADAKKAEADKANADETKNRTSVWDECKKYGWETDGNGNIHCKNDPIVVQAPVAIQVVTAEIHCANGNPIPGPNGSIWCEVPNDRFSGAWASRRGTDAVIGCLIGLGVGHGNGCGQAAAWALGAGWAGEEIGGQTGRWIGVIGAGAIIGVDARPKSAATMIQGGRVRPQPYPAQ